MSFGPSLWRGSIRTPKSRRYGAVVYNVTRFLRQLILRLLESYMDSNSQQCIHDAINSSAQTLTFSPIGSKRHAYSLAVVATKHFLAEKSESLAAHATCSPSLHGRIIPKQGAVRLFDRIVDIFFKKIFAP